jgi:hypothetical protein
VKDAKEWAAPRVEHALEDAREWAAPRARGAYKAAARKANPYAKKAGAKAEQWVDYAQGALVGAAIPAVLAAFDRAAEEERPERRGFPWGAVLIPAVIAGAAGAALVMWAKRDPGRDEWAGDDEWDYQGDEDFSARLRRDVNRAADATAAAARKAASAVSAAATTVAEQAGPYVEKAKEQAGPYVEKASQAAVTAAQRAKEQAAPIVEKATATVKAETAKVIDSVDAARHRAASEIADVLDDAADVWDDEVADEVTEVAKEAKKAATTAAKKATGSKPASSRTKKTD